MENTSDSLYFGKQIILGVDRLDYIKGLLQKVAAFKNLLENFPQLCGQVRRNNFHLHNFSRSS